jgi:hypothetical protein
MESKPIYGLHVGLQTGQHDRVDELNERMLYRAFDKKPIKPVFDPRSVSTKYSPFPILDRRTKFTRIHLDDKEPVGQNVETETDLYGRNDRNAVYDYGSQFKPSLESDMYKVVVGKPSDLPPVERALLFEQQTFERSIHPNLSSQQIGNNTFYNHTRTQLRGGTKVPPYPLLSGNQVREGFGEP